MADEIVVKASSSDLKLLETTRVSLEKFRIQVGNRASAFHRGDDEAMSEVQIFYSGIEEAAKEWEKQCERMVAKAVHAYPIWDYWLKDVKGIGEGLAAQMLSMLLPPLEDRGPSTWYKAAGLTVETHIEQVLVLPEEEDALNFDEELLAEVEPVNFESLLQMVDMSRLPRARVGGGKLEHHKWLRRCLYNVGTSFVRNGGYYREVYDHRKRELFVKHARSAAELLAAWENKAVRDRPEWLIRRYGVKRMLTVLHEKQVSDAEAMSKLRTPKIDIAFALEGIQHKRNPWPLYRIDAVARWKMVKFFLSHLYEMWLESEGKTGRQAYVVEQLGHHYVAPPRLVQKGKKI